MKSALTQENVSNVPEAVCIGWFAKHGISHTDALHVTKKSKVLTLPKVLSTAHE